MQLQRWNVGVLIAALVAVVMGALMVRDSDGPRRALVNSVFRDARPVLDPFLIELEERTFRFFWDTANPKNGLIPDRYPTPSFSSIAAVGFGLTAYPIGIERGYVTREAARQRVLATLRFFRDAPQGPSARGVSGYKGFFYHFIDMKTGERFEDSELSTVDTAILLAGMLFCQSYFSGPEHEEVEIRDLAEQIYRRVDWGWAQPHAPAISLGWSPEDGFLEYDWRGYNEAMLVYLLALGSPTCAVGQQAWTEWTSTYDKSWRKVFGQEYLSFAPLFGHQYTHVWMDFRKIQDDYMRGRGLDYFENSRRAVYAQHRHPRRLHARAHGNGRVDPVRAGAGDSGGARNASAFRTVHLFPVRLLRRLQLELPFRCTAESWPRRRGIRLGGRRLSRHRPGTHLRDDRKPAHGAGLARHEEEPASQAGSGASRLLRRL